MGVSMYLTADNLSARSELYGHMFDVHLSGFETREITVKNIDVQWIEEVILSRTVLIFRIPFIDKLYSCCGYLICKEKCIIW